MAAFFEHQAEARRNTRWLLLGMAGAVCATGAGLYGLLMAIHSTYAQARPMFGYAPEFWHPRLFLGCVLGTAFVVSCASAFRMFSLRGGGARVAEMMGGRLVSGQPRNRLERRLLNVVEEMAIASGVPVPQVFMLDAETGINAFAAGFSLDDAAIAVTRGTLEKLTRSELQGVIAHEFSHVLNGDMRLNTRLIGTVFGILCIGLCGRALMRLSSNSARLWNGRHRKSGGGGYLFVLGLGVFLVGWLGELMGKFIKAAVSRQREFLADASAAQFTRDPLAVAAALKKIGGHGAGSRVDVPAAQEASHLFFGDLTQHFLAHSWLATHPPLSERIQRLDPSFRGEFVETPVGIAEPEDDRFGLAPAFAARGGGTLVASEITGHIGQPHRDALEESRRRLAQLPEVLHEAASNPFSACALVYALWLGDRPEQQSGTLARIAALSGGALHDETARWAPQVAPLRAGERLSLVELAAPALRELSPEQRQRFVRTVESLTLADGWTSIFEHVVGTMLTERVMGEPDGRARSRVRYRRLMAVRSELELLLSVLAHAGDADGAGAQKAFGAAAKRLHGVELKLLPASDVLLRGLGPALTELRALAPVLAERVVAACAECVITDRRVTADETALLRAVCDGLGCPLPLFDGEPIGT